MKLKNEELKVAADANETGACWVAMLARTEGTSCILTTRQNLPILVEATPEKVAKGAYVLFESGVQDSSAILFVATGSEVHLCLDDAVSVARAFRRVGSLRAAGG